jgi:predicted aspartyl protease
VYSYDSKFNPPAPVLLIQVSSPSGLSPVTIPALVDSGADITVIPRLVAQDLNLQPVYVTYSKGFGGVLAENTVLSALVSIEREEPEIIGVLTWDEDYVLLGRDIINHWKALLDGPGLVLTVSR